MRVSRLSSLDRAALLALSLALPCVPACVTTQPDIVNKAPAPAAAAMPTIEVGRGRQTAEPPVTAIKVVAAPRSGSNPVTITAVRAESPIGAADLHVKTAGAEQAAPTPGEVWAAMELNRSEPPLVSALRCYLNKAPEQAARCLESMDPADRELLTALLPLACRLGDGELKAADPQDLAAIVADLQKLVAPIRERAALEVPKLCFCRPVAAPVRFGVYDVLEENHLFRPGDLVGLYFEVRNFTSVPQGADFRTQVRMAIEVQNERGETVSLTPHRLGLTGRCRRVRTFVTSAGSSCRQPCRRGPTRFG